jgi:Rrf2 family protein
MLTKTSITAIRLLIHVGQSGVSDPASVRQAADRLNESPPYLAKVAGQLVRSGVLRGQRGVAGGVSLARPAKEITMLVIVEACQGAILGDFCQDAPDLRQACAFHRASAELHRSIVQVLSRWTLAELLKKPDPSCGFRRDHACWIQIGNPVVTAVRTKKRTEMS